MSEAQPKVASQMPEPKGYKLLVLLPDPDEKTEGGILKAKQTLQAEEVGTITGFSRTRVYPRRAVIAVSCDCNRSDWLGAVAPMVVGAVQRAYFACRKRTREHRHLIDKTIKGMPTCPGTIANADAVLEWQVGCE